MQNGLHAPGGPRTRAGIVAAALGASQEGRGQVVLLSGEPGLANPGWCRSSKSGSAHEGATRIEFRCSPYHQNSALYPIIEHLQRLLQFQRAIRLRQAGETPTHAEPLSLPPGRDPASAGRVVLLTASRGRSAADASARRSRSRRPTKL